MQIVVVGGVRYGVVVVAAMANTNALVIGRTIFVSGGRDRVSDIAYARLIAEEHLKI